MYSFGLLPKQPRSGHIIGTHQKVDRIARRKLRPLLVGGVEFPRIDLILHFEGMRGPDGVKLKSPGRDEPWHFIDPSRASVEDELFLLLRNHRTNLVQALRQGDDIRAAFEASWMAHAIADGLTPAHHEPLAEQLKHLKHKDESKRTRVVSKVLMAGHGSKRQFISNNWQYWGAKGIMTTHTLFEAGVAMAAKPLTFRDVEVDEAWIRDTREGGFEEIYLMMIKKIDALGMYERFRKDGWTQTLARQTTKELLPLVVQAVTLAWYEAWYEASKDDEVSA